MVTYNKTIKNLAALRNALYKSNLLFNPVRDITSITSSGTGVNITYSEALETAQAAAVEAFITNFTDVAITDILKVENTNKISINEESKEGQTQGSFSCFGINFDAPLGPGNTPLDTEFPFTPGYAFTALLARVTVKKEMNGDTIDGIVLPQNPTAIGVCVADVNDHDTVIYTTPSVLAMIEVEKIAMIVIFDMATGRLTSKVRVISIDTNNTTLTLNEPINIDDGAVMSAAGGLVIQLDNNIVGYTTAPSTVNEKWINCDENSMQYLLPGRFINLFGGNTNKTVLRCIEKQDLVNNKVMINAPFNVAMPAMSYIQMTLKIVRDIELHENWQCEFGTKTIGGSTLTSNNIVVMHYRNNGPKMDADGNLVTTKRINCNLECLY
jgi:hypothetical protein